MAQTEYDLQLIVKARRTASDAVEYRLDLDDRETVASFFSTETLSRAQVTRRLLAQAVREGSRPADTEGEWFR